MQELTRQELRSIIGLDIPSDLAFVFNLSDSKYYSSCITRSVSINGSVSLTGSISITGSVSNNGSVCTTNGKFLWLFKYH